MKGGKKKREQSKKKERQKARKKNILELPVKKMSNLTFLF